jgi:hypothetical protein
MGLSESSRPGRGGVARLPLTLALATIACLAALDPLAAQPAASPPVGGSVIVPRPLEVHVAEGDAARGATLVSIPYGYRRTGVLAEDIRSTTIWLKGVLAPKGSPAYHLGRFSAASGASSDVWCFLPRAAGGSREHLCLVIRTGQALADIAPKMNPYLVMRFSFNFEYHDMTNRPVITEGPMPIGEDLRLEYRFKRWRDEAAELEIWAGGEKVASDLASRGPDGFVTLNTISGVALLKPGRQKETVSVTWTPTLPSRADRSSPPGGSSADQSE